MTKIKCWWYIPLTSVVAFVIGKYLKVIEITYLHVQLQCMTNLRFCLYG